MFTRREARKARKARQLKGAPRRLISELGFFFLFTSKGLNKTRRKLRVERRRRHECMFVSRVWAIRTQSEGADMTFGGSCTRKCDVKLKERTGGEGARGRGRGSAASQRHKRHVQRARMQNTRRWTTGCGPKAISARAPSTSSAPIRRSVRRAWCGVWTADCRVCDAECASVLSRVFTRKIVSGLHELWGRPSVGSRQPPLRAADRLMAAVPAAGPRHPSR